jgi:hypothetical protein
VIQGKNVVKAVEMSCAYLENCIEKYEYENLEKAILNFEALGQISLNHIEKETFGCLDA